MQFLFHCYFLFASPVGTWSVACTITTFNHFFSVHVDSFENSFSLFIFFSTLTFDLVSLSLGESFAHSFIFNVCTKIALRLECFVFMYRKQNRKITNDLHEHKKLKRVRATNEKKSVHSTRRFKQMIHSRNAIVYYWLTLGFLFIFTHTRINTQAAALSTEQDSAYWNSDTCMPYTNVHKLRRHTNMHTRAHTHTNTHAIGDTLWAYKHTCLYHVSCVCISNEWVLLL